ESADTIINIDHHIPDRPFGSIQLVDSRAAATTEILWEVIRLLSVSTDRALVSSEVADCLMTGIITDTGSFRFLNVRPQSFRLAARLQQLGAQPAAISELVFDTRSLQSIKLLGRALDSVQVNGEGTVAWAHVTRDDFLELGATDGETEGIVSHVRAIRGVAIGALLREIPGHKIRISLRARDGADVNRVAAVFGGGGHRLAAGCSIDAPLAEAECLVVQEAERQLHGDLPG
ncbi:MAG TPA: DHHA1 domain-containing protein, partial [Chthonomonadales bacterium]|nr:DHHA1 domain-containing protein [Chthonomonadales bacterium]